MAYDRVYIKKVSDGEVDQALILVKLTCDFSGLTVSQLVRFLRKYHRHLSKPALIKRVHRALDKLEERRLVVTEVVGTYRFARLTENGLKAIWWAVDLTNVEWVTN